MALEMRHTQAERMHLDSLDASIHEEKQEFKLSWEEFCEKMKEYLASRGDSNPEEAVGWYEDFLRSSYQKYIVDKRLSLQELNQEIMEISMPILMGL